MPSAQDVITEIQGLVCSLEIEKPSIEFCFFFIARASHIDHLFMFYFKRINAELRSISLYLLISRFLRVIKRWVFRADKSNSPQVSGIYSDLVSNLVLMTTFFGQEIFSLGQILIL